MSHEQPSLPIPGADSNARSRSVPGGRQPAGHGRRLKHGAVAGHYHGFRRDRAVGGGANGRADFFKTALQHGNSSAELRRTRMGRAGAHADTLGTLRNQRMREDEPATTELAERPLKSKTDRSPTAMQRVAMGQERTFACTNYGVD